VELAAPVDADVQDVLGIELEVQPRAAVRDHPRAVEELPRRVRLALVVIVEHARAAVELADDDPLRPVDDERALVRHQRDLAEVDLLLLDVADRLGAGLLVDVPHDEADDHLDGRRVGHAARAALVDVVLRLLEVVAHELERGGLAEVLDREDALEHTLQPDVLALVRSDVLLQEFLVGLLLDIDQVRNVNDLVDLGETLPDPEVILNDRAHLGSFGGTPGMHAASWCYCPATTARGRKGRSSLAAVACGLRQHQTPTADRVTTVRGTSSETNCTT
jgi:hypothetical protein